MTPAGQLAAGVVFGAALYAGRRALGSPSLTHWDSARQWFGIADKNLKGALRTDVPCRTRLRWLGTARAAANRAEAHLVSMLDLPPRITRERRAALERRVQEMIETSLPEASDAFVARCLPEGT